MVIASVSNEGHRTAVAEDDGVISPTLAVGLSALSVHHMLLKRGRNLLISKKGFWTTFKHM